MEVSTKEILRAMVRKHMENADQAMIQYIDIVNNSEEIEDVQGCRVTLDKFSSELNQAVICNILFMMYEKVNLPEIEFPPINRRHEWS